MRGVSTPPQLPAKMPAESLEPSRGPKLSGELDRIGLELAADCAEVTALAYELWRAGRLGAPLHARLRQQQDLDDMYIDFELHLPGEEFQYEWRHKAELERLLRGALDGAVLDGSVIPESGVSGSFPSTRLSTHEAERARDLSTLLADGLAAQLTPAPEPVFGLWQLGALLGAGLAGALLINDAALPWVMGNPLSTALAFAGASGGGALIHKGHSNWSARRLQRNDERQVLTVWAGGPTRALARDVRALE